MAENSNLGCIDILQCFDFEAGGFLIPNSSVLMALKRRQKHPNALIYSLIHDLNCNRTIFILKYT